MKTALAFLVAATIVLALLLLPGSAGAAISTSDGSDAAPYGALLGNSYMPLPSTFTVVPSPGGCPGQVSPGMSRPAACADSNLRMYVDPARIFDPSSNGSLVISHETGHIVDFTIRARDGGVTDKAFDDLMTQAGVIGYRLEIFADTWAACSMWGPTGDTEVITPSYAFHIPADAYAQACELFRQASVDFLAAPATYSGAPWRKQAHPGDCMSGAYVVPCAQPAQKIRYPHGHSHRHVLVQRVRKHKKGHHHA